MRDARPNFAINNNPFDTQYANRLSQGLPTDDHEAGGLLTQFRQSCQHGTDFCMRHQSVSGFGKVKCEGDAPTFGQGSIDNGNYPQRILTESMLDDWNVPCSLKFGDLCPADIMIRANDEQERARDSALHGISYGDGTRQTGAAAIECFAASL